MRKSSVLEIGPDPVYSQGGMATVIQGLLDSEEFNNEFDVEMHPSFEDGPMLHRLYFSARQLGVFVASRKNSDIYHIHMSCDTSTWRKSLYVKLLGLARARRVVLHVHGSHYQEFFDECSEAAQNSIRRLFHSVGAVVVLSEEWREIFLSRRICPEERLYVVHNGVRIPDHEVIGSKDYTSKRILFMGRLSARKSPDTILKAAKQVIAAHPETRFTFAGDGDIDTYRQIAASLGVTENCDFVGWVSSDDKESLFKQHSIYCLPSTNEGMPMSVLEAMSYGLATVVTPVGGVPQIIEDRRNGFLVPVGDYATLANRLVNLLSHPVQVQQLGSCGWQTVSESFSVDSSVRSLITICNKVIKSRV